MGKTISMQELNAKAQELGTVGDALQWAKANGYEVDPQNGFAALPPEEGEELPPIEESEDAEEGALPLAVNTAAGEGGATTGPLSSAEALRNAIVNLPAEQEAAYKRIFQDGQNYFAKMYAGPTRSQQLFALSKALLSPTPYRGFAGAMSNITGALGDIEDARAEAMRKRAEAERQLQQSLATSSASDRLKALQLQYNLYRTDQAAAAAGKPKYQWDSASGRWVVQPGSGDAPPMNAKGQYVVSTPQEAAAVPSGQPFVYTGDATGKIYYGQ